MSRITRSDFTDVPLWCEPGGCRFGLPEKDCNLGCDLLQYGSAVSGAEPGDQPGHFPGVLPRREAELPPNDIDVCAVVAQTDLSVVPGRN